MCLTLTPYSILTPCVSFAILHLPTIPQCCPTQQERRLLSHECRKKENIGKKWQRAAQAEQREANRLVPQRRRLRAVRLWSVLVLLNNHSHLLNTLLC